MLISDASPKGQIFELSALDNYGYCQTYVLLMFLAREFFALKALDGMFFTF